MLPPPVKLENGLSLFLRHVTFFAGSERQRTRSGYSVCGKDWLAAKHSVVTDARLVVYADRIIAVARDLSPSPNGYQSSPSPAIKRAVKPPWD